MLLASTVKKEKSKIKVASQIGHTKIVIIIDHTSLSLENKFPTMTLNWIVKLECDKNK